MPKGHGKTDRRDNKGITNNNDSNCIIISKLGGAGCPQRLREFSFQTRDQTQAPAVKAPSPNHWTAGKFPF